MPRPIRLDQAIHSPRYVDNAALAATFSAAPLSTTCPFCSTSAWSAVRQHAAVVAVDDQRGDAVCADLADDAPDLGHDQRRQAFGGLVQDDQLRVRHQRAADRQHLLLAAGQLRAQVGRGAPSAAGRSAARARSVQSSRPSRPRRAAITRFSRTRQVREHAAAFGHVGHAQARHLVRPGPRACPGRTAGCCPSRCVTWPEQRADQRALAHAVAAEQAHRLAARDAAGRRRAARGWSRTRRAGPCASSSGSWCVSCSVLLAQVGGLHLGVGAHRLAACREAMTAPLTITVMRSAMRNTASMSCSTSRIAWPAFSSASSASMRSVSSAPMPASGSSSSSTCGCGGQAHGDLELALLAVRQQAGLAVAARRPGRRASAASRAAAVLAAQRCASLPPVPGRLRARLRRQAAVLEHA